MIYFRSHIQAFESQIARLQEQSAAREKESRDSHIQALESQISWLQERLAESDKDRRELLDRLLAKNNIEPVAQAAKAAPAQPDMLTPFGVTDAQTQEAYKESWLREETEYLMGHLACDEITAREYAERQYLSQHQVIPSS